MKINTFSFFQRKFTTLSFEGNRIKCLTAQGKEVLAWGMKELARSQMDQGIIRDPQAAREALSALFSETGGTKRKVITSVTDQRSIHRVMTVPNMKKKLLDEAIYRKAKQEFPTPAEETDFAWQLVRESEDQITVYVLAVPKVVIDQQVNVLQALDINPKVMDAKPLSLMHATDRERCIIVNLEEYSMAVIIVINNLPAIVRTVPLDNEELSKEAKLDLLSQELARTTKFYNESHKEHPLPDDTLIYATGELFAAPKLDERLHNQQTLISRLGNQTGYPIQIPSPPLDCPPELPIANYAVNLGLVIKGNS